MKKVGITGGKCTGKRTVLEYIREKEYPVLNLEDTLREVLEEKDVRHKLQKICGLGRVERRSLWEWVDGEMNAAGPSKVKHLLVPLLLKKMSRRIFIHSLLGKRIVFINVPFLYECSMEQHFDKVVVVTCGPKTQEERILENHHGAQEARKCEKAAESQIPLLEKRRRCDDVIDNNRGVEETYRQVDALLLFEHKHSPFFFVSLSVVVLAVIFSLALARTRREYASALYAAGAALKRAEEKTLGVAKSVAHFVLQVYAGIQDWARKKTGRALNGHS